MATFSQMRSFTILQDPYLDFIILSLYSKAFIPVISSRLLIAACKAALNPDQKNSTRALFLYSTQAFSGHSIKIYSHFFLHET